MKRIFIGGVGRSGTTITLNALYNHHQVLAFPVETKFLVEEDGFAELIPALTRDFSVAASESAIDRFGTLMRNLVTGLDDSKFLQQHELPISLFNHYGEALEEFMAVIEHKWYFDDPAPLLAATRRFVSATFDSAARVHGYEIWVEKTPSNIWRVDFLRELWPDCEIVHCIRDPRDVLISFLEKKWLPENLLDALTIFEGIMNALMKVRRQHIDTKYWNEIRLEELVQNPSITLDALAQCIHIEPFRDEAKATVERAIHTYYAEKARSTVSFTPEERNMIVSWLRPAVVELGYPEHWSTGSSIGASGPGIGASGK